MTLREKLIQAYKDNFCTSDIKNSFIKVKAKNNIAIWTNSNNVEIKNKMFNVYTSNGKDTYDFGSTNEEIIANAEKFSLVVFDLIDEKTNKEYAILCIPEGAEVEVCMEVEEDVKFGSHIDKNYVSEVIMYKYNKISIFDENMSDEFLNAMFTV